ncbi:MAG: hypothetical protein HN390_10585 [Anaerolineae bacterium]|jgi:hypothetical protein|nr:hypothetical protein [Anaerolineae bacterium]
MMKTSTFICIVLVIFSVSACTIEPLAPSDFPYDLMLQASDLPQGYVRMGGSFPQIESAFSHIVGYDTNPEIAGGGISHQITIYPSQNLAIENFPSWENEWITNAWVEPANTHKPANTNDLSVLKCLDIQIENNPTQSCTYLQQHKNLVILVLANIDSKNMNFQQFLDMLENLDTRLPSSTVSIPTE